MEVGGGAGTHCEEGPGRELGRRKGFSDPIYFRIDYEQFRSFR
jgi:hypothetical protein